MSSILIASPTPPPQKKLRIKCTYSGAVYLKEGRYHTRYMGSKTSYVEYGGRVYPDRKEYWRQVYGEEQKNSPRRERREQQKIIYEPQSYKKLSTYTRDLLTYLSTFRVRAFDADMNIRVAVVDRNLFVSGCPCEPCKYQVVTGERNFGKSMDGPLEKFVYDPDGSYPGLSPYTLEYLKYIHTRRYRVKKSLVRQRLLGYINTMKGKKELYFWTVTFPEGVPDDLCYRAFNTWLTSLRQRKMLREYLWIAERQENGTVHFHLGIPHFMNVHKANAMMRGTLKNLIRKGEIKYSIHRIRNYNGVDIAKNRKTKRVVNFALKKGARSLASYLTKYVTKNNTAFTHLAWHNSRGYSSIFTGVTYTIQEFIEEGLNQLLDRTQRLEGDFFIFIPWQHGPPRVITRHLYDLNSFIQSHIN